MRSALLVLLAVSFAARAEEPAPVLVVVPPGTPVASVQKARGSMPAGRTAVLVGATPRIPLAGGLALQADRTFADAPAADLVVVLPGEAPGLEEFLAARKMTASAILFAGESPIIARLPAGGSALVLAGGLDALPTLTGSGGASAVPPPAPPPTPAPASAASSSAPASSAPPTSTFGRYFSSSTPTPTPKPKNR